MPNYTAHKIDELFETVTARQMGDLNSTERIGPVDPVERDETKEVKPVERVENRVDGLKDFETMPDIEHPECFIVGCGRPRKWVATGRYRGTYAATCAECAKEKPKVTTAATARVRWQKLQDGTAYVGVPKPATVRKPRTAPPVEARADSAAIETPDHTCTCPGGGNPMQLERELLRKMLDEIAIPDDLRADMELIVLLVERIVAQ